MNELALFAGGGGGILGGVLLGWHTICAVEIEPYCRSVLLARQRDGILSPFPIWDDVRTFDGNPWRGHVDVISAGFPCQPFSVAGQRKGSADKRNLWPDTIRIIQEVRPHYALLENVPGLLSWDNGSYFEKILGDLAESGFDAEWGVLSAADVGAPHIRKRLWILAHHQDVRCGQGRSRGFAGGGERKTQQTLHDVANATSKGPLPPSQARIHCREKSTGLWDVESERCRCSWWKIDPADTDGKQTVGASEPRKKRGKMAAQPEMGRVAHGVANRVGQLRALGNGQVPAVAATAWRILYGRKGGQHEVADM